MEDPDQLAVYDAQDIFMQCLDRAKASGVVQLDGHEFHPETEPRFSTPDDVDRYVQRVFAHLQDTGRDYGGREQSTPAVRARKGRDMAHYSPATQTIAVPSYEVGGGWALRGTIALHEMAHHLAPGDEHGNGFRATFIRLLEDIGSPEQARLLHRIFESASLSAVPHHVADGTLERMAQILRQAENTPYEHERELFMDRAQALATRHQVALAVLRGRNDAAAREDEPQAETYTLGKRGTKGLNRMVMLMSGIGQVNNVQLTIAHDSRYVVLFGFAADIKVVKALYASLIMQLASSWKRYLADNPTEPEPFTGGRRNVPTITRRLEFTSAFVDSVTARLRQARHQAIIDADLAEQRRQTAAAVSGADGAPSSLAGEAAPGFPTSATEGGGPEGGGAAAVNSSVATQGGAAVVPGTGAVPGSGVVQSAALVLRARELEVSEAFKEHMRRNNVRGTWRGARGAAGNSFHAPEASQAGHAAGRRASLGGDRPLPH